MFRPDPIALVLISYGALYLEGATLEQGARVHHDLALTTKVGDGETQWVLLSSGIERTLNTQRRLFKPTPTPNQTAEASRPIPTPERH